MRRKSSVSASAAARPKAAPGFDAKDRSMKYSMIATVRWQWLGVLASAGLLCTGTPHAQSVAPSAKVVPKQAAPSRLPPDQDSAFQAVVAEYRAATAKPQLPEQARKFKVQAEDAINEKQFDEAAAAYAKALEIAPWWPEGHFNRALVFSNIRDFAGAVDEMQRYLALVPDAPDARAAQDKIYAWQRKL